MMKKVSTLTIVLFTTVFPFLCLAADTTHYNKPFNCSVISDGTCTAGETLKFAAGKALIIPSYTVATLPTPQEGMRVQITDGASASDCTVGSGSTKVSCIYRGSAWEVDGGGGSTPSGKVCKTIQNISGSDNLKFDIAATRTITKVSGFCDPAGTTASFILKDYGTNGATGPTNIHNSLTIDNDGANTGAISYAITDGSLVRIVMSAISGVVTEITVCYE